MRRGRTAWTWRRGAKMCERTSSGAAVVADFLPQVSELTPQRADLAFELRDTPRQSAVRRTIGRKNRIGESKSDLITVTPLHVGAYGPLLLRDIQINNVRNAHGVGKNDARAGIGEVADQTIKRIAAFVEIDAATMRSFCPASNATAAVPRAR